MGTTTRTIQITVPFLLGTALVARPIFSVTKKGEDWDYEQLATDLQEYKKKYYGENSSIYYLAPIIID